MAVELSPVGVAREDLIVTDAEPLAMAEARTRKSVILATAKTHTPVLVVELTLVPDGCGDPRTATKVEPSPVFSNCSVPLNVPFTVTLIAAVLIGKFNETQAFVVLQSDADAEIVPDMLACPKATPLNNNKMAKILFIAGLLAALVALAVAVLLHYLPWLIRGHFA